MRLKLAATPDVASPRALFEAQTLVGAAIAIALHSRGFVVSALPGESVKLTRGDLTCEPFRVMEYLANGHLTAEAWSTFCTNSGLDQGDLAAATGVR